MISKTGYLHILCYFVNWCVPSIDRIAQTAGYTSLGLLIAHIVFEQTSGVLLFIIYLYGIYVVRPSKFRGGPDASDDTLDTNTPSRTSDNQSAKEASVKAMDD